MNIIRLWSWSIPKALTLIAITCPAQDVFSSKSGGDPCEAARSAEMTLYNANLEQLKQRESDIGNQYSRDFRNCTDLSCKDRVSKSESAQLREVAIARADEVNRNSKEMLRIDSSCTAAKVNGGIDECARARAAEKALYEANQLKFKLRESDIGTEYTKGFTRCEDMACKEAVSQRESDAFRQLEADRRAEETRHRNEQSRIDSECSKKPVYTTDTYARTRAMPMHGAYRESEPAGRTDGDEIRYLSCPEIPNQFRGPRALGAAIIGASMYIEGDSITYLALKCATIVKPLKKRWTWGKLYWGDSAGKAGRGTAVNMTCPTGYIVSGVFAAVDASWDHVRDIRFECSLIVGPPASLMPIEQPDFPVAGIADLDYKGQGGFGRNAQTRANRNDQPRTYAERDLPFTSVPDQLLSRSTGFGASAVVVGIHDSWGKQTIRSVAVQAAGRIVTTRPNVH